MRKLRTTFALERGAASSIVIEPEEGAHPQGRVLGPALAAAVAAVRRLGRDRQRPGELQLDRLLAARGLQRTQVAHRQPGIVADDLAGVQQRLGIEDLLDELHHAVQRPRTGTAGTRSGQAVAVLAAHRAMELEDDLASSPTRL